MIKVVSWNIWHRPDVWRALLDSDADVALLQEACAPPSEVRGRIEVDGQPWHTAGADLRRNWRTAIVKLSDRVKVEWIPTRAIADARPRDFAVSRAGTIAAAHITNLASGSSITMVSMYAAWENPHTSTESSWIYADASVHRLISDLSVLVGQQQGHRILAAGDLNVLHGHGEHRSSYWKARYATVFERMNSIGMPFVGPQYPNGLQAEPWPEELPRESQNVPTFRTRQADPSSATRQLDFVFASTDVADHVKTKALNAPEQWGPSDHCRIAIEVDI